MTGPPDELDYLGAASWKFLSQSGVKYESGFSINNAEPEFAFELFPGASVEGWIQQVIRIDDPSPRAVFGSGPQLAGGIWFALVAP